MKAYPLFKPLSIVFLSLTLNALSLTAQPPAPDPDKMEERRDEIESMKIGFLTRKLDLTSEEAKAFWPVYNKFQDELEAVRKQRRNDLREFRENKKELTDKDAEKLIDNEITGRQKELDIMKKYHAQFKQILPVKKVLLLYRAEEDFKRELLDRLRDRKEGPPGSPRFRK
jgi:Spy/CpxP family protein refolding chaperone